MIIISTDTALTYIHPLFLHDALPICSTHRFQRLNRDDLIHVCGLMQRVNYRSQRSRWPHIDVQNPLSHRRAVTDNDAYLADRKSTRLNSSHVAISYAVFCLKKKTN